MYSARTIDIENDLVVMLDSWDVRNLDSTICMTNQLIVDVKIVTSKLGYAGTITGVTMRHNTEVGVWTIFVNDIKMVRTFSDGDKVMMTVSCNSIRTIECGEVVIVSPSKEKVISTLSYEYAFIGTPDARIVFGNGLYYAHVYEGSSGTTPAHNIKSITHRGPLIKGVETTPDEDTIPDLVIGSTGTIPTNKKILMKFVEDSPDYSVSFEFTPVMTDATGSPTMTLSNFTVFLKNGSTVVIPNKTAEWNIYISVSGSWATWVRMSDIERVEFSILSSTLKNVVYTTQLIHF